MANYRRRNWRKYVFELIITSIARSNSIGLSMFYQSQLVVFDKDILSLNGVLHSIIWWFKDTN